ncbi:TRAP transporter substrate-binding protein DctP [Cryobacterium sp. PH29-G1]|uniref:TRAP transporter substrate-binding protein DctP n=1 Tax=Cryobacterium sp. PH29-G1 TaxID=3046211 RepID=UPI0024B8B59E|nr:TRAP transporter substrate-binding protein DctP [Cryobacterium sp. PH29-G1]MDJ0347936.1 TRAP transporter substrate-binding protein DctP [Cryobacterium sp. PH29-G1]
MVLNFRTKGTIAATLLATAALALSACSAPASTGGNGDAGSDGHTPVTLSFVTAFPETSQNNDGFFMFVDKLKEKAPWVTVEYKGGPEVMAPNLLIEGVSSGAIDGAHLPGDYYVDQLPVMEIARFTPFTPSEERENGITEQYQSAHDTLGVHYLGHTNSGMPQLIFVQDKMSKPDFEGRAIRVSSATSNMVLALNGNPVALPGGEIFSALERGVVKGSSWSSIGVTSLGFQTEVKYNLAPRFYESLANTVINKDKWDSLDAETQDAFNEAMIEIEPEIFDYYQTAIKDEARDWRDAGIETIEFDADDTQKMLEIAYVDAWDALKWDDIVAATPEAQVIRDKFEAAYDFDDLSKAVPGGTVVEPSA